MTLRMWYAVHGEFDVCPSPAAMLESVRPPVTGLVPEFEIRDGKWQAGRFRLPEETLAVIRLTRVLRGEDDFPWDRDEWETELKTWDGPMSNCDYTIQQLRKTHQTVHVMPFCGWLGKAKMARICEQLCGYLACATEGLIHVYQAGFFNRDGESLHPYCPQHRLKTR
jgi:hypothetical protein